MSWKREEVPERPSSSLWHRDTHLVDKDDSGWDTEELEQNIGVSLSRQFWSENVDLFGIPSLPPQKRVVFLADLVK